jgi:FkbM family methyltransferase
MKSTIRKILLTLQSEFSFLTDIKESLYFHARLLLRIPHENDFKALTLIRSSSQQCYVDVGANKGQSIESMLLFKPDAQVVSFEANPMLAQKLERRYGSWKNIRIVPKGLADSVGQFTLFVPRYKRVICYDLASLSRESAANWINEEKVFRFDPAKLNISEFKCEVCTLDMQHLKPAFIKVDVQGLEYNVLNGARETLRQWEPILLIEDFRGDPRTAVLAEELGYEEYRFDGVSFKKGKNTGDNSFLITPQRFKELQASSSC